VGIVPVKRFILGLVSDGANRENREFYLAIVAYAEWVQLYIASGSLLNTRAKQLFTLVADWTTCEKPLAIEKFRSSYWIPSTGAVKACQSMSPQLKSPAIIQ